MVEAIQRYWFQDVVWDWKNKRWYMATQMSAAVSYNMVIIYIAEIIYIALKI